ncbi:hypothetical protein CDAR_389951 [Caerostris darwini]|uniref:Uncharacterized protein n=1 Tax=Caerostris darwini TaxID=1538125 RepID=A0AAV4QTU7_9ARAC|nr:hypothetical protein CDAR_389951 [Caerostris darwini]
MNLGLRKIKFTSTYEDMNFHEINDYCKTLLDLRIIGKLQLFRGSVHCTVELFSGFDEKAKSYLALFLCGLASAG